MSQSASDLIMGGGAPAAKFHTIGTIVRGEILETATSQITDYTTGEPKVWKDGSPRMQAILTIQTDQRDPEIVDDDGKRRLFVASRSMKDAVRDAVTAAGKRQLELGGKIAIQYTGDGENAGGIPPKLYKAEYKPPVPGAASSDLLGNNEEPF